MATGIWQIWREVTFTYPSLPFFPPVSSFAPHNSPPLKSPPSPFLSYISCIRRKDVFLLDIHDTRYPVLLPLHPIWEIYVYYVRTLTLLELAVLLFTFIMGYHYGLWRLRFGLLFFSSLQCNCSFSFLVYLQKWLRWGVYLVHIGMVGLVG